LSKIFILIKLKFVNEHTKYKMFFGLYIGILFSCQAAQMKVYSAGEYTIYPSDYDYAHNIIVELWSAGGSTYNWSKIAYSSGSGAYLKASISTLFGFAHFQVKVGRAINNNTTCNGENSWFRGKTINLTLEGGYGSCGECLSFRTCGLGGKVLSIDGSENVLSLSGESHRLLLGSADGSSREGGSAPYGGIGYSLCQNSNGTRPGGGAGGKSQLSNSSWGGNGTMIIYF
jgi:hypothetical protein